jgi:hypothetical protein
MRSHQKHSMQSLQHAIKECVEGSMTSVGASKRYCVPESTIRNHKRQPLMSIGSGRRFLLHATEEEHLVQLLLDLEKAGFRLTREKVVKVAQDYVAALKKIASELFSDNGKCSI